MERMSENTSIGMPGLPSCMTTAVESGDPSKGASVLLGKGSAGCLIPWHWHTPTERVMIVSATANVEMKDSGKTEFLGPGGYAIASTSTDSPALPPVHFSSIPMRVRHPLS